MIFLLNNYFCVYNIYRSTPNHENSRKNPHTHHNHFLTIASYSNVLCLAQFVNKYPDIVLGFHLGYHAIIIVLVLRLFLPIASQIFIVSDKHLEDQVFCSMFFYILLGKEDHRGTMPTELYHI
jgi:hypothetical protein